MILANNFQTEYQSIQKEIDEATHRVLTSGWYILGKEVEQFEQEFAQYLGVKQAIGVGNGLEALQIGLMALGIGPEDEVITTSLSAVATALAISNTGATPIFADIDDYFHLDPILVEKKITKRTKAILPVHLYGQPVNLSAFQKLCKKYNLILIEDAAQAHGAEYQGKKVGSFGLFSGFSFYPTKNLGAYGDAGAIVCADKSLSKIMSMLRNYGQETRYRHEYTGINSRLDELQAAVLKVKLQQLDTWNKKRIALANIYSEKLSWVADIELPHIRSGVKHVFHQYVIRTKQRDELLLYLQEQKISALVHYPIPIHQQPCYPQFHSDFLPKTVRASQEILSLPIHPFMRESEQSFVIEKVKAFFTK